MKITASNWFNTSFSPLRTYLGDAGTKASTADKATDRVDSKRLNDLQEALSQLKVTTNSKQMAKEASAEKIGMLQRRLMELKQMLLYATPEQASALARELKSIASELSSVAKAASAASSGGQATPVVSPVVAGAQGGGAASASSEAEASVVAASTEAAQSAGAHAAEGAAAEAAQKANGAAAELNGAAADQADKATREDKDNAPGEKRSGAPSDSTGIPDKVLNDMLKEAKRLLKEVIDMVKLKVAQGDKEARQNLADAEKKLQDGSLDTETQLPPVSLYSSQGVGTVDGSGVDGPAATGSTVSVEA